jgi:hypothetical protein
MSTPVKSTPSHRRKLRPDARKVLLEKSLSRVHTLYEKPVEELTPEEITQMKRAFFASQALGA